MIEKAALIIVNVLVCQASLQVVTTLKMVKPKNSSRNSCSTQKLVRFILWNYHHTLSGCVPNVPVIGLPIWSAHQALDAMPLAAKLEAICSKQSCDTKTILQNLWCLSANRQSEVALWCSLLAPPILSTRLKRSRSQPGHSLSCDHIRRALSWSVPKPPCWQS